MNENFDFDAMIDRIKQRKKELGMTNKQLSDTSGVSFGTLNKILGSETKEPSINNIIKISSALKLSTEYVITGSEKSNSAPDVTAKSAIDEPIAVKASEFEWRYILNKLSDDNLLLLRDYAQYLLWRQGQAAEDSL